MSDHTHVGGGANFRPDCDLCRALKKLAMDKWRATEAGQLDTRRRRWASQGMDPDEAEAVWRAGGGCRICGKTTGVLVIDHDHETGEVRGILCRPHNSMLGFAEDDPAALQAGIDYLRSFKE